MDLEILRNIILFTGWPVLIAGSVWLLFSSYRFFINVKKVIFGRLVLGMTFGWLLTMYSLGIVATIAMYLNTFIGALVVFPIFLLWSFTMALLFFSIRKWTKEAVTINEFYQDIERKYQSIFELSPEAILLMDANGTILAANERLHEWVDFNTADMIGRNIMLLPFLTNESRSTIMKNLSRRLLGQENPPYNIEFTSKKGEIRFGRVVDSAMKDEKGKPVRNITMISDFTERIKLEQLRDDLTHMIVHDLKTPLSGITGITDLLLKQMLGPISDEQKKYIETIEISSKKLTNLIMDLLDIKKIEDNKLELKKALFPASELVNNLAWLEMTSRREGKELAFYFEPDLSIFGDQGVITRVLENLIGNAIKHTPKQGRIGLSIRPDNGHILFEVTDSGEGIPSQYLDRIFDKFFKVEKQEYRTKIDTGLGLAFCKMAVEAHGGNISVASDPNKETRFSFKLKRS